MGPLSVKVKGDRLYRYEKSMSDDLIVKFNHVLSLEFPLVAISEWGVWSYGLVLKPKITQIFPQHVEEAEIYAHKNFPL